MAHVVLATLHLLQCQECSRFILSGMLPVCTQGVPHVPPLLLGFHPSKRKYDACWGPRLTWGRFPRLAPNSRESHLLQAA